MIYRRENNISTESLLILFSRLLHREKLVTNSRKRVPKPISTGFLFLFFIFNSVYRVFNFIGFFIHPQIFRFSSLAIANFINL